MKFEANLMHLQRGGTLPLPVFPWMKCAMQDAAMDCSPNSTTARRSVYRSRPCKNLFRLITDCFGTRLHARALGQYSVLAFMLFSGANQAVATQQKHDSANSQTRNQGVPEILPGKEGRPAKKKDGVLTIPLANGKSKRYKDNLSFSNGTLVTYHYKGYIRKIDAHIIDVQRIGVQTVLLSNRTGDEVPVGGLFSISSSGKKIFTSTCQETFCFYNVIDWPSGREEYIKKQALETGVSSENGPFLLSPVERGTVRWKSDNEISFTAVCAFRNGKAQYSKVLIKLKGAFWQQQQDKSCS